MTPIFRASRSPLARFGQESEKIIAALNTNAKELRRQVTKGLTLKFSPKLRFLIDQSFDQMDETRRLLSLDDVRKDLEG